MRWVILPKTAQPVGEAKGVGTAGLIIIPAYHLAMLTFNSEEGHKAAECEKPKDPARTMCRNCDTSTYLILDSDVFRLTSSSGTFLSRLP